MIGDKIILEGISKCGKTIYAEKLRDKLNAISDKPYKIVQYGNNDIHDYMVYRDALMSSENIIFDGFMYAQFAYRSKDERNASGLNMADLLLLEDIIANNGFSVIYVYTDDNNVFQNTQKDSKYSFYTLDYIHSLCAKFEFVFDTISSLNIKKEYITYTTETNNPYTKYKADLERFDYSKLPYTIAVEFDDVIAKNAFPNIAVAVPNYALIERIKILKEQGTKFILWTRRTGSYLTDACNFCMSHGIYFDAINTNIEEIRIPLHGGSKKVWANEYWESNAVKVVF